MFGFHHHEFDVLVDSGHYMLTWTNPDTGHKTSGSIITKVTSKCFCGKFRQQTLDGHVDLDKIRETYNKIA